LGVGAIVYEASVTPPEGDVATWMEGQHAAQPRRESRPSSVMLNSWFDEMRKTFRPLDEADPDDRWGTEYSFYKNFISMNFAGSVSEEGVVTAWKLAQKYGLRISVGDELLPREAPEGERHVWITVLDGRKTPGVDTPNICIAILDPAFAPPSDERRWPLLPSDERRWVLKQLCEVATGDTSSPTSASSLLRQWDDEFQALDASNSVLETRYFQGFILLRLRPKDAHRISSAAIKLCRRLYLGLALFENLP
jgi:hypothetical protein